MKVANVDGLVTLYYDGTELYKEEYVDGDENELFDDWYANIPNKLRDESELKKLSTECRKYWEERLLWQQIIVAVGVTEIPEYTFFLCLNIERVIFADTVTSLKDCAFHRCQSLKFIKWSKNTEFLGHSVFDDCDLSSAFIPPKCKEICDHAFSNNENLKIFVVPQETKLGTYVIENTELIQHCPVKLSNYETYSGKNKKKRKKDEIEQENRRTKIIKWIKGSYNDEEKYQLHRASSSIQPLNEAIFTIIKEKGIGAIHVKNDVDVTALDYLKQNPYIEVTEKEVLYNYIKTLDTAKDARGKLIDGKPTEVVGEEYKLHRACSSIQPLNEEIFGIKKEEDTYAVHVKDDKGLTPLDYLEMNPNTELNRKNFLGSYFNWRPEDEITNEVQSSRTNSLQSRIQTLESQLSKQTEEIAKKNEELIKHKSKNKEQAKEIIKFKKEIDNLRKENDLFMSVELLQEEIKCCLCYNKFSTDINSKEEEIRRFLPVLSRAACPHYFCQGCILQTQLSETERTYRNRVPTWLDCMICKRKKAFCPKDPNYHLKLMELLQRAQRSNRPNVKIEENDDVVHSEILSTDVSNTSNEARDDIVPSEIRSSTNASDTSDEARDDTMTISENVVDDRRQSKRLRTSSTAVPIKKEDIVDGVVKCPVCQVSVVTSDKGCNIITCRNHSPHFVYFCIHCKKVNENGVEYVTCSCESRNTRETRAEAQKRRNAEAMKNPIELD